VVEFWQSTDVVLSQGPRTFKRMRAIDHNMTLVRALQTNVQSMLRGAPALVVIALPDSKGSV